ncbi:DNA repair protein RecO C-terminal domain-containing protein [Gammaproteobacteria bacterium]|nr:DNA repair protein RecO C-terminal domain-containing protein [Gammaproteobacteria bacterium]
MSDAYLIHSRPYNEKKQFQVLFTKEHGMTSIAVGSKTIHHPFTKYALTHLPGRKARRISKTPSPPIILHGKKLYCGLYLNELIYLFCKENDPYPQLFKQYEMTLALLNSATIIDPILRQFELALIEEAGYALYPEHVQEPYVTFSPLDGLLGHNSQIDYSVCKKELEKMRYAQSSSSHGKKFIKHILNTLLTRQTKSRFFYESVLET